jgi:tetratricopeptide (TPR) repeat protein
MLRLHYYYGEYEAALGYADRAWAVLPAFQGQVAEWEFMFYCALARAAHAATPAGDIENIRSKLLKSVEDLLGRFEVWATAGAANFAHKRDLIRAELLRARGGDRAQAAAAFETALESAAPSGFVQDHALAYERAALFHQTGGDAAKASAHFDRAAALYQQWEAFAKADAIIRREAL